MYKVTLFLVMIVAHIGISQEANPLIAPFNTPFNTIPFDKIQHQHFMPALEAEIKNSKAKVLGIVNNKKKPTFENTIIPYEQAGIGISRVTKPLFHLNGAEKTPEIQEVVKIATQKLNDYRDEIVNNQKLFKKIEKIYSRKDKLKIDQESKMLIEKTYKSFVRNGVNLPDTKKAELKAINDELSALSIKFSENVLNATNAYKMHITDEAQLKGLPSFVLEAAALAAKKKDLEGWVFTLQAPSFGPFLQYADNRKLREEIFKAFNTRAAKEADTNNDALVERIVNLRHQKAVILGYNTWAEYTLEERMANKVDIVYDFLNKIKDAATPVAKQEMQELLDYAKKNGFDGDKIERWDYSYYTEKLKKEKLSINDELLKPYFKLENVLEGMFELSNKLYGITFVKNEKIPTWHEEVMVYEVYDHDGSLLAIWYGDYFPRPGKRSGAWNNTLRGQYVLNGEEYRPHVVNVCNFSRPTETKPSLLTHYEVVVLFHEFGHAMHDIFAKGKYSSLTGTSVAWDFVELPSQLFQNFVYEPEVLKMFARHYETNESIPDELIKKISESSTFMQGMTTSRQLSLGLIDMHWHTNQGKDKTIDQVEQEADITRQFFPKTEDFRVSNAFSHIFSGGYSAGYYSYKWAEVLDADGFEFFKENGLISRDAGDAFRNNILSKGGSEKPMELYKKFRGREPDPKAMLIKAGLYTRA